MKLTLNLKPRRRLGSTIAFTPNNSNKQPNLSTNYVTKTFHSLKVVSFNANSLTNKIDELKIIVATLQPDVIGVSETHLLPSVDSSLVNLNGYSLYRCDRKTGIHGGVAIYIRSDIPSHLLHTSCDTSGEWESIWCFIKTVDKASLKIGCCYSAQFIFTYTLAQFSCRT